MTHKKIVLALLLLLVACSGQKKDDPVLEPFVGGVNGLQPIAIEGSPPQVVTDAGSQNFAVAVGLENQGEANVGPGTENPFVLMRLSGFVPEHFGTTKEELVKFQDTPLRGAKKNFDGTVLPGETGYLSFTPLMFMQKIVGSELFTMRSELCYDYATHSTMKVCIKDEIREHLQDSTLCSLRSELNPANSGSLIHVIEANQNPVGDDRIQVNFAMQNLGPGTFYSRAENDPNKACSFDRRDPTIYKALVVVHPVDAENYDIDCRGLDNTKPGFEDVNVPESSEYGVIKFHDNSPRSLSCFLTRKTEGKSRVFQELLNVDIYYRYGVLLDIPLLVQEAGGLVAPLESK